MIAPADDPLDPRADTRPTILVVEDDREIRSALVAGLELSGYRVQAAANGREALDGIDGSRPALIIADLRMPVMDGVAFAAELGRRGLRPGIPLLLLSGEHDLSQQAQLIGAERWLSKPLRFPVLLGAIVELLMKQPPAT
jgi:two-component system, chemotaxis family, chemotaxis protein CheY